MEQKEFEMRKNIVDSLYKIKKDIDLDNPLPVEKVITKAGLQRADAELVHEEYIELLDRMKKVKDLSGAEKKKAQKVLQEPIKHLSHRFCTGCGIRLREGVKFCTKCGRPVKK